MDRVSLLAPACDECGLTSAHVTAVVRHIDHLAAGASPDEQRRLRSHVFALLALLGTDLAGGNE